jgi:hypothetical protein
LPEAPADDALKRPEQVQEPEVEASLVACQKLREHEVEFRRRANRCDRRG